MSRIESAQIARVRDARAALLLTHPFFGVLALKMELNETRDIPTAGVDTKKLHFNPDFIDTLTQGELKAVMAHEVLHLALGHHARQGTRAHGRWNKACDYALNPTLVDDGFILPKDALLDAAYKGMSAEAIYERLAEDEQQNGGGGAGAGKPEAGQAWGDFTAPGPEGSAECNESLREWQENAAEAAKAAKAAGKLPGHIAREIEAALAPRANWKSLFKRFMTDQVKPRSTWSRPNKRFPGIYLPGTMREGLGCVVFMIDTSGSIDARTLGVFESTANDIIREVEPAAVHVIYADADVHRVDSYEAGEDVKFTACGGGGTDFRPAFERIRAEGWTPAAAVYLTDLYGAFPDAAPEYPVLWLNYGAKDNAAPWGETVALDE